MRTWKLAAGVLMLLGWAGVAGAQDRGTTGADFLKIGLGAAAAGSGEAFTARAGDLNSMFYNPAGLAGLDMSRLSAMHLSWIADTQYEAVAFGRPMVGEGTIGASIYLLHMPDIPALDENNLDAGTLRVYDVGVQFSCARDLGTWLAVPGLAGGANFKILHRELAGAQASGLAFDLGTMYTVNDSLTLGLSALNIGYLSTFEADSEKLPTSMRAGACYARTLAQDHGFSVALDLVQPWDNRLRANAGVEYSFRKLIFLRAGYMLGYDVDGFQAGAGFSWQNINLDYAVKPMGLFGLTQLLSASVGFGTPVKSLQENKAREILKQAEELFQKSQYPQALDIVNQAVAVDPGNEQALTLRDKLRSVLEMLNLSHEGNSAPGSSEPGTLQKPLSPDQKEETGSTPGEAKP